MVAFGWQVIGWKVCCRERKSKKLEMMLTGSVVINKSQGIVDC